MKWATKSAYKPAKCIITRTKTKKYKNSTFLQLQAALFSWAGKLRNILFRHKKSHILHTKNKFDVFKHTTQTLLSRHQFLLPSNPRYHFVVGIWLVITLYEGNHVTDQDPFIFNFQIWDFVFVIGFLCTISFWYSYIDIIYRFFVIWVLICWQIYHMRC